MLGRGGFIYKGFTIIELLIAMVIMSLVFTVGFANLRQFASRQKIEGAVREIKADLRLAQQEAVAGKKPAGPECDSATGETLVGYEFRYEGPTSYSIYAVCTNGNVEIKTVDLSQKYPDVEISSFTNFTFEVLSNGVSDNRVITVREFDSERTIVNSKSITVTTGGQIS